jgi:hypothetical protein
MQAKRRRHAGGWSRHAKLDQQSPLIGHLYRRLSLVLVSLSHFDQIYRRTRLTCAREAMSRDPEHVWNIDTLLERLRRASSATPDLVAAVIDICERLHAHRALTRARLAGLIQSGAVMDAGLTLIELELPRWKLSRLIHDGSAWHCSLSTHRGLPPEIDDSADAMHDVLPLAVLGAFLNAKRADLATDAVRAVSVPQILPRQAHVICCDNFA